MADLYWSSVDCGADNCCIISIGRWMYLRFCVNVNTINMNDCRDIVVPKDRNKLCTKIATVASFPKDLRV